MINLNLSLTTIFLAILLAGPAAAGNLPHANGESLNGASFNGISVNGRFVQGTKLNGRFVQGTQMNGRFVQGTETKGHVHDRPITDSAAPPIRDHSVIILKVRVPKAQ